MSPSKCSNQRHHAKTRARQRYGLELNRHSLRLAVLEGRRCRVIYDKVRKNIVTFLPPEDAEAHAEAG